MSMPNIRLEERPEKFDVPEFLRAGMIGDYLNDLKDRVNIGVSASRDPHIAGLDGTLVLTSFYENEVKPHIGTATFKSDQLVTKPTKESVDGVLALALQEIQEWVPKDHQVYAMAQVEESRPKYAANVEEAALALGIPYNRPQTEGDA